MSACSGRTQDAWYLRRIDHEEHPRPDAYRWERLWQVPVEAPRGDLETRFSKDQMVEGLLAQTGDSRGCKLALQTIPGEYSAFLHAVDMHQDDANRSAIPV